MSEPIYETPDKGGHSAPIFKGFTPLPPGTYTIWSQRYAGNVVDLYDSQPQGQIQGFPSHTGNNQRWILTPQGEPTLVTWQPVSINSYAYTGGNIAGSRLIGNYPVSSTWEVTMRSPNTGTIGIRDRAPGSQQRYKPDLELPEYWLNSGSEILFPFLPTEIFHLAFGRRQCGACQGCLNSRMYMQSQAAISGRDLSLMQTGLCVRKSLLPRLLSISSSMISFLVRISGVQLVLPVFLLLSPRHLAYRHLSRISASLLDPISIAGVATVCTADAAP
ncbi:hypothetical protein C8R43DRAFT_1160409 [Mycena crocata]|nr:hypothetical protein C8R43DRAFT_1160409 [Mycena crocata]